VVFRNIRIKMANGKTRIQKAKVLASGKLKFVKNTARTVHRHVKKGGKHIKHRVTSRKSSKNRAPVKRNNSKRSRSNGVVGKNILKKIPLINNPIVRKVFIAAGAVSIIVSVLSLVSPRAALLANGTIGRAVIGLATGDVVGAVANVAIPAIQSGGLGSLTGGGNGGSNAGANGFA